MIFTPENECEHVAFRSFRNQQVAHNGVTAHSYKTEKGYRRHLFIFCVAAPLRFALLRPLQVYILFPFFPFPAIALLEFTKGAVSVCNHRSGVTKVARLPKTEVGGSSLGGANTRNRLHQPHSAVARTSVKMDGMSPRHPDAQKWGQHVRCHLAPLTSFGAFAGGVGLLYKLVHCGYSYRKVGAQ